MASTFTESSIEETIEEVTNLATELRNSEKNLDDLIAKGKAIKLSIESMKDYQEESLSFDEITKVVTKRNKNSDLILWLAAENKELEQLRQQNSMLNNSIEEHEAVIEIVMTKYRNQMNEMMKIKESDLIRAKKILEATKKSNANEHVVTSKECFETDSETLSNHANRESSHSKPGDGQNKVLEERISTMATIAKEMADQSDLYTFHLEGEIQRLKTENSGLRELLEISFSNLQNPSSDSNNSPPSQDSKGVLDSSDTVYNHHQNQISHRQEASLNDSNDESKNIKNFFSHTYQGANSFDQSNSVSSSNELGDESDDTIVDH